MSERIVVACRMSGEQVSRPETRYLDRARALTQRAEALGATLAAWSATTVAFAWDIDSSEEAIEFVGEVNPAGEEALWGCGLSKGGLIPLAGKGGGRADLAWGDALVVAVMLARAGRPGEVLVDAGVELVNDLVATGKRIARDGERKVLGIRIEPHQPWKRDAGASLARLQTPPWVPRADLNALLARPGVVHVVRADPGQGGSRALGELAAGVEPGPCLFVAPAGASVEPLGALRRALVRFLATHDGLSDPELSPVLDMFLVGIGASIEQAASIVSALLRPSAPGARPGALLLDDAGEIDAETLEACGQAVAWTGAPSARRADAPSFHVFVRVDATDQLPVALATLPQGWEIELGPLDRDHAQQIAVGATAFALTGLAARKVARRAGNGPLGVMEALAYGLGSGELVWSGEQVSLRGPAAFAGKPVTASHWIRRRAKATSVDERAVLTAIALLGGEAPVATVIEALRIVEPSIDVTEQLKKLVAGRWLVQTQVGWVGLPSRSHRDTLVELLDEAPRQMLHGAIADVLEQNEGELGCAEAAHHAVKAGEGERGARLALRAARAAARAGMSKSATRLLTLARLADPKCEPLTRKLLTSLPPPTTGRGSSPSIAPPSEPVSSSQLDEPPTKPRPASPPPVAPPLPPERDSEFPTLIDGASAQRAAPSTPDARIPLADETDRVFTLDRATLPDPLPPPYVLHPPPAPPRPGSPAAPPLPAAALEARRPVEPALPRPMAPLPLRPAAPAPASGAPRSAEAPSAPRPPVPASGPGAPRPPAPPPFPPARLSQQKMPAVVARPPAPPPAPPPIAIAAPPRPAPPIPPASDPDMSGVDALLDEPESQSPESLELELTPEPSSDGVAAKMIELAKSALLERDSEGLERWTESLRAAGEHDRLAGRIEALGRVTRGQHVGEALRALRALRDDTDRAPASTRAQASLALALALAAADRPHEALLEGLDGLARAREGADARAAGACLAFLAKLYDRLSRPDDALALRTASRT